MQNFKIGLHVRMNTTQKKICLDEAAEIWVLTLKTPVINIHA